MLVLGNRTLDMLGCEPSERAKDIHVALGYGPIGLSADAAETSEDRSVGKPQGDIQVAPHGQHAGDRQSLGQFVVGSVLNELGQASF